MLHKAPLFFFFNFTCTVKPAHNGQVRSQGKLAVGTGDRLEEVTIKAVSTVPVTRCCLMVPDSPIDGYTWQVGLKQSIENMQVLQLIRAALVPDVMGRDVTSKKDVVKLSGK